MQVQTQGILFDHIEGILCVRVCVCAWQDEFSC